MNKEILIKVIEGLYSEGIEIIREKNSDYSKNGDAFSNFRFAELVGISPERAILVRVSDKLARISNLLDKENEVKDETIYDTILDMINYMAILHAFLLDRSRTGVDPTTSLISSNNEGK